MITKFDEFLNESRGISDIIKEYTEHIYDSIIDYINDGEDVAIEISLVCKLLPLRDLYVDLSLSDKYYGKMDIDRMTIKNNEMIHIGLFLTVDKNNIKTHKIKQIITHELTHIIEYYNIKVLEPKNKIKVIKTPKYISVRNSINKISFDNEWNTFKSLIYY